ncbi:MAG: hypothetical protein GXY83_25155 [Rhodopirellula sp.]|nr:hypothetical protein [Rhodopirellula sp.]
MKFTLPAVAILSLALSSARAESLIVSTPPVGEKAYQLAGEAFVDLWQEVTGRRLAVHAWSGTEGELPEGDIVVIGSDAVHPLVHRIILDGTIDTLGLQYGADGYRMLCVPYQGRRLLILAGGCGKSTLYAVYDFFRRQAGVEYFWDGDAIPNRDRIDFDGLDVAEQPHFAYRGLRYFAHRGLHRFQAEHWDFEDWKREIDWLVKSRFNLFMLRTGIDDLFQRAFPDEVHYPPVGGMDPDGVDRSYNDRTSFWPLRYRGELRKQVLRYAFDRGLIHPEDTGTPTHWYSHTPSEFFRARPDFPVTKDQKTGYSLSTHAIWDIADQRAWDTYWKLSETHVREFGEPRMFHTIGLAERTFGKDARENLQRKLYVYRKTQQMLREHYPDAPLIIAGWDFIMWWKDEDVHRLLAEFDSEKTIVFDYTADDAAKVTFRDWNLLGNFPWFFGIFHSFARNSDIHEDYGVLAERLRMAAPDPKCRGLFVWSEISHSDTFLLEYLAANSWRPTEDLPAAVTRYCQSRYPDDLAERMASLWKNFLITSQSVHWTLHGNRRFSFNEPQNRLLNGSDFSTLTPERMAAIEEEYARIRPSLEPAPQVLEDLAEMSANRQQIPFWRRDALDMARTIASRALLTSLMHGARSMEAWREGKADAEAITKMAELSKAILDAQADVLFQSDEFSMFASLERLKRAEPLGGVDPAVNPHAEQTLKSNAENDYCRSHHYELVRHVYRPEFEAYWAWVLDRVAAGEKSPWRRPAEFGAKAKAIEDEFYATPLAEMAPQDADRQPLGKTLTRLGQIVQELIRCTAE